MTDPGSWVRNSDLELPLREPRGSVLQNSRVSVRGSSLHYLFSPFLLCVYFFYLHPTHNFFLYSLTSRSSRPLNFVNPFGIYSFFRQSICERYAVHAIMFQNHPTLQLFLSFR